MERSGANAFVYGRLCGMLGKSFVGGRESALFDAATLADLWTAVFGTEVPLIPQMMLAQKIEVEAERRFIAQYTRLFEMYDRPAPLLFELLRFYDVENLKEMGAALCSHETDMPRIVELGSYSTLNYDKWPNIAAVTASSPFSWYDKSPTEHEQQYVHVRLDNQYVGMMWEAAHKMPQNIRKAAVNFVRDEAVMNNIAWALRLKVYYNMEKDEVQKHLSSAKKVSETDEIAGPAMQMLEWPADSWDVWSKWKYAFLLNPHDTDDWSVDPLWVERESKARQQKAAERLFRAYPLTEMPLVAWFRIKQHECDMIRMAAEGIRLGIRAV